MYLHPGPVFASVEPATVTTVLGSCVSGCLFDPSAQLGGINHYLLPHWVGNGTASPRFGNVAMETLLDRVLANEGEAVITELVFPSETSRGVEVFGSMQSAKVRSLDVWTLKSAWR